MKNKRWIAGLLSVIMLTGLCSMAGRAESNPEEVSILFTHDLHSHLDVTYGEEGEQGGFGKLKTCIEEKQKENPRTFVLDGGDFSMGTLYQTIFETHASELVMLGRLGYDATTFGNHEFDYREEGVANMLNAAVIEAEEDNSLKLPAFLSANIDWEKNDEEEDQLLKSALDTYGSTEYTIIEREGIRAGVFGVLGEDAEECAPESGLEFEDIIVSSKRVVEELKEKNVDIIICLSHSGTWEDKKESEDELLAEAVPDIDVIISGHTHTELPKALVYGNTYVVSSGSYGKNMGELNLVPDGKGRWKIKEYTLNPMDETVETDEEITELLKAYKETINKEYLSRFGYSFDQVIAENLYDFTPIEEFALEQKEDTLGNLISDSYVYAVQQAEGEEYENVDLAVVASGVIRESFEKGNITVSDVFNVSSLGIGADKIPGYPLVSIYLTGKELKTIAELDASISPLMPTAQLYPSGMEWSYNTNRMILNKVTDVKLVTGMDFVTGEGTNEKIENDRLYRVVSGLYAAQMLGAVEKQSMGILSLVPKDKDGNKITNYEEHIVHNLETGEEVKEWSALASYVASFEKNEEGISVLPARYEQADGRKQVDDSKNIGELLKKPNRFFFIVVGIVLAVAAIFVGIIVLIVKKVRKVRKTT